MEQEALQTAIRAIAREEAQKVLTEFVETDPHMRSLRSIVATDAKTEIPVKVRADVSGLKPPQQ